MLEQCRAIDEELNKLRKEGVELSRSLQINRVNIRRLESYARLLRDQGKEYADFSKLIYAECTYVYDKRRPEDGTETVKVSLDLEGTGRLVEVYRYRIDNSVLEWSCSCRLGDVLRFYGQAKARGYNPSIAIEDYYQSVLGNKQSFGTLFANLGRLLEDSLYGPAFDYAATSGPVIVECSKCSKWRSISRSIDPTGAACASSLLNGLGYFEEKHTILCDCEKESAE